MEKKIASMMIIALLCCVSVCGAAWLTVTNGGSDRPNCSKYDNQTVTCMTVGVKWVYLYADYTKGAGDNITYEQHYVDAKNTSGNAYKMTEVSSSTGKLTPLRIPFDNATNSLFIPIGVPESSSEVRIKFNGRTAGTITTFGATNYK